MDSVMSGRQDYKDTVTHKDWIMVIMVQRKNIKV